MRERVALVTNYRVHLVRGTDGQTIRPKSNQAPTQPAPETPVGRARHGSG